jgi:hypothetical protein
MFVIVMLHAKTKAEAFFANVTMDTMEMAFDVMVSNE